MHIRLKRVGKVEVPLPEYATDGAAGLDLRAALEAAVVLAPMTRQLIPTGLALELPAGLEAQVRPRSGLANEFGVTVLNAPGTIDSDYRGEIGVVLINHGNEEFRIQPLMRIAQLVVAPVTRVQPIWAEELASSERGGGGYGSTGTE